MKFPKILISIKIPIRPRSTGFRSSSWRSGTGELRLASSLLPDRRGIAIARDRPRRLLLIEFRGVGTAASSGLTAIHLEMSVPNGRSSAEEFGGAATRSVEPLLKRDLRRILRLCLAEDVSSNCDLEETSGGKRLVPRLNSSILEFTEISFSMRRTARSCLATAISKSLPSRETRTTVE